MTALEMATTQATLVEIAALSLELTNLDAFIEETAGTSPTSEAVELRDLAEAVAAVQRVAHRQLGSGAAA